LITLIQKTEKLDVLVVSAHPDDGEIGCGGIIKKLTLEGKSVGIIDLTDGEPTPHTINAEERLEEAKSAGNTLGIDVREVLDLPNRILFDSFEARIALADRIREYRPKIIISQYGMTPHDSPDHYQAQLITEGAIFYARLTKWKNYLPLPVHRVYNLFYYATLRESPPPEVSGLSKVVIDITQEFEPKKKALSCYKSQFKANPKNPGIVPWIETMALYYGKQIDKKYGEALFSPKSIEIPNLDFWLNTH
jgi:bacillithiol biosynthesis deacetylase BshB1